MAKAGKNRHSDSTRTPPVIDHEPLNDENEKARQATPEETIKTENNPMSEKALPAPEAVAVLNTEPEKGAQSKAKQQKTEAPKPQVSDNMEKKAPLARRGSSLAAGVCGGIIALAVAGGLQWAGVLSSPANHNAETALQEQIDVLKADIAAAKNIKIPDQKTLEAIAEKANTAAKTAADALSQMQASNHDISMLKTSLNSLGAQNGDSSSISALSAQITGLEDKAALIDSTNQRLAEIQGVLDQTRARINGMEESLAGAKNLKDQVNNLGTDTQKIRLDLTALNQQVKTLEERPVAMPAQPDDRTELITANALKAAVDRGSSYVTELQNFENVAKSDIAIEPLKKYAAKGLPSAAELSKRFTRIADAIAATENDPTNDAGLTDKLWSSARRLIISRPVGNVEGETPGAIAARMEVAIEKADYDRALNEWQALPDNAKAVSTDFMNLLTARRDADRLLNQLVTVATQPRTPTGDQ